MIHLIVAELCKTTIDILRDSVKFLSVDKKVNTLANVISDTESTRITCAKCCVIKVARREYLRITALLEHINFQTMVYTEIKIVDKILREKLYRLS